MMSFDARHGKDRRGVCHGDRAKHCLDVIELAKRDCFPFLFFWLILEQLSEVDGKIIIVVAANNSEVNKSTPKSRLEMNLRLASIWLLALISVGGAQADRSPFVRSDARGGAVTTSRAAWGAKPTKQSITVKTTRQSPLQQQQHEKEQVTKEQIDAFLTRDSRNTFIGTLGVDFDVVEPRQSFCWNCFTRI